MDFPLAPNRTESFPWRAATIVAAGVAAVELVLLVVVGGALLAKPAVTASRTPAKARSAKATAAQATAAKGGQAAQPRRRTAPAAAPAVELPRRKVEVLVLNGNGRTGAAAAAASRVGRRGYRVSAVGNAPRHDYPESIVLYRRGFSGEGKRLARDLGVHVVGPLDGMRSGQLQGAHVVYILGP